MTIYFHNPGEIDIRGATIMGLNAKEDASTAIGFFGTGLKYSISCILRLGGSITIWSGLDKYEFGADNLNFRGKDFQQVTMSMPSPLMESGRTTVDLGFTTEYGKAWEPWQVFRELLANARDEGGDVTDSYTAAAPGQTVIEVSCPLLEAEYLRRHEIILPANKHWQFSSGKGCIGSEASEHLYYRGVRVHSSNYALTYNMQQGIRLTEDRTVASSWYLSTQLAELLGQCDQPSLITQALLAGEGFAEHDFDFAASSSYSSGFLDVASELYQQDPKRHRRLKPLLEANRPDAVAEPELALTTMQQLMLNRAIRLCDLMGMPASSTPVKVVHLGGSLGQRRQGVNAVFLDPKVFEQGTKQVVSTLYEELLHKTTGLDDCCYEMQTHLFNKIVSMYEEHVFKEPC